MHKFVYIACIQLEAVQSAVHIENNLARPVIIQIPTLSPGRYAVQLNDLDLLRFH